MPSCGIRSNSRKTEPFALDRLQFPISMFAIIGRLTNYNQHNFPSSSRSPYIPLRFHDKAICSETLRDGYESCVLFSTPSCGSSVRRWVANRTKQASALDVALFRSVKSLIGRSRYDFGAQSINPSLITFFRAWTWAIFVRFAKYNQHHAWSSSRPPCIPLKAGSPCAFIKKTHLH